jgi:hypothetical protein
MILIAHRGLTDGPDRAFENHPKKIVSSLKDGFDCEIDVRYIDGKWFLGHDVPEHEIPYDFLEQPGLWIHAKNLDALYMLGADAKLNYFWHQEDDFTLTSKGEIWTYPGQPLTRSSIMVQPERDNLELEDLNFDCFGICSKYVRKIKKLYSQRPKSLI